MRPTPETDAVERLTKERDAAVKRELDAIEAWDEEGKCVIEWQEKCFAMRELSNNATELAEKYKQERDEAREALKCLDEAMRLMNPRYIGHPTMDGRHPCWVVWLPKDGKVERKSLRDAFLEFFAQIKEGAK